MNLIVYFISLFFLFVSNTVFSEPMPITSQLVKQMVEKKKLLPPPLSSECVDYVYFPDNEPGMDSINVVEKHGGNCPGDPQISHRLFTVNVNKKTHEMSSDISNPEDGIYLPFPPK